jgi:hypothetical protein
MSPAYRSTTYTAHGLTYLVEWLPDDCADAPWEHCDIPGGEFRQAHSHYGPPDKRPGELRLSPVDRTHYFYDYSGAVAQLRREGMAGPDAATAARNYFDWLDQWFRDQWSYAVVRLSLPGTPLATYCGAVEDHNGPDAKELASIADLVADLAFELLGDYRAHVQQAYAAGHFPAYA